MKKALIFLICVLLLCSCNVDKPSDSDDSLIVKTKNLEEAISEFLLESSRGHYLMGECCGEGHLVLGIDETDNETTAYLLTMYGEYGFANDKFIKVSGSGVIPAVMKLENTEDGYKGVSIEYPDDGANHAKSIKEMFPKRYHMQALLTADTYYDELKSQEEHYAKEYLEEIGRDAQIGEYADLNARTLTSYGIPVETSNMLLGLRELENYPLFVGKEERIEDGVRYVYELMVDEQTKNIIYKKYPYKSQNDIKEIFEFDQYGNEIKE